jgi:hypothetical protein
MIAGEQTLAAKRARRSSVFVSGALWAGDARPDDRAAFPRRHDFVRQRSNRKTAFGLKHGHLLNFTALFAQRIGADKLRLRGGRCKL